MFLPSFGLQVRAKNLVTELRETAKLISEHSESQPYKQPQAEKPRELYAKFLEQTADQVDELFIGKQQAKDVFVKHIECICKFDHSRRTIRS